MIEYLKSSIFILGTTWYKKSGDNFSSWCISWILACWLSFSKRAWIWSYQLQKWHPCYVYMQVWFLAIDIQNRFYDINACTNHLNDTLIYSHGHVFTSNFERSKTVSCGVDNKWSDSATSCVSLEFLK